MPAVAAENLLLLPRLPGVSSPAPGSRPVAQVITAHRQREGAGFEVRRPFPGAISLTASDPFLLLDHIGPQINPPNGTVGAPWHPHRGFETVTYVMDGEIAHHDTNGGGGVIGEGDTQKMTAPRYQALFGRGLTLLASDDGGALIRLIAGELAGLTGPGVTHTPITYAHATLAPGSSITVPWATAFNAFAYVLTGRGAAGAEKASIESGQLVVFGPGDHISITASDRPTEALDLLFLGGLPIREPIAHYGPFLMNNRADLPDSGNPFHESIS